MILKLTFKGCEIPDKTYQHLINHHLAKINQALPHTEGDLLVLRIVFKKNIDMYHPKGGHSHHHKDYRARKPIMAYYEGSITFRLDKKQLYVHFKGQSLDECLNTGFGLLYKELEKFKDSHFSSESEYPGHSSIRGGIL